MLIRIFYDLIWASNSWNWVSYGHCTANPHNPYNQLLENQRIASLCHQNKHFPCSWSTNGMYLIAQSPWFGRRSRTRDFPLARSNFRSGQKNTPCITKTQKHRQLKGRSLQTLVRWYKSAEWLAEGQAEYPYFLLLPWILCCSKMSGGGKNPIHDEEARKALKEAAQREAEEDKSSRDNVIYLAKTFQFFRNRKKLK